MYKHLELHVWICVLAANYVYYLVVQIQQTSITLNS